MNELRPLPLGRTEFLEWCDRIIAGACIGATRESLQFTLADILLHLGPQEDHKEDIYFIKTMRKYAINQVAISMRQELKDLQAQRIKELQDKEAKAGT